MVPHRASPGPTTPSGTASWPSRVRPSRPPCADTRPHRHAACGSSVSSSTTPMRRTAVGATTAGAVGWTLRSMRRRPVRPGSSCGPRRCVIEPRKQWPRGLEGRSGNIATELRARRAGRSRSGSDPGWSEVVAALFRSARRRPRRCAGRRGGGSAQGVALGATARVGDVDPLAVQAATGGGSGPPTRRARQDGTGRRSAADDRRGADRRRRWRTPPRRQPTSWTPSSSPAPTGSALPTGPGLVVDDALRSGWTMTALLEIIVGEQAADRRRGRGPHRP